MYFRSVKFYKHMIYFVLTIFVASVASSLVLGVKKAVNYINEPQEQNYIVNAVADEHTVNHYPKDTEFNYQTDFPNLYARAPQEVDDIQKGACYLTFDDGPSKLTKEILDILDENNVKATFFVVVNESTNFDIINDAIERGHAIGIHSNTHKYQKIYQDVNSFLDDMNTANDLIYEHTHYRPTIIRFPGGSVNSYNAGFFEELISEVVRRNYHYFDWNVSFEDATKNITLDRIIDNISEGIEKYPAKSSRMIILAHDGQSKYSTVDALQQVIDLIKANGYTFETLDNSVPIMSFNY